MAAVEENQAAGRAEKLVPAARVGLEAGVVAVAGGVVALEEPGALEVWAE